MKLPATSPSTAPRPAEIVAFKLIGQVVAEKVRLVPETERDELDHLVGIATMETREALEHISSGTEPAGVRRRHWPDNVPALPYVLVMNALLLISERGEMDPN